jgi:radical SAM protein with 4Fe4S-binding SPASM domain
MLGGCGAGIAAIAIDSRGNIMPCTRLPYNLGNIKKTMLSDIWIKSKELKRLRDRSQLKGSCGKCNLKNLCGGCRAKAYLNNKDLFGEDPECFLSTYKRITAYKLMKEGEVNLKKDKLKEGKEKMEKGISILSETQLTDIDLLFIGLGYEKIRNFEKALLIYKALIKRIKTKDLSLEYALKAMIIRTKGKMQKNKKLFLEAEKLFKEAAKHSKLFRDKWIIAGEECKKLEKKWQNKK